MVEIMKNTITKVTSSLITNKIVGLNEEEFNAGAKSDDIRSMTTNTKLKAW